MQEYSQTDFEQIVGNTRKAFETGRTLPVWWRKKQLKQIAAFLEKHDDDIKTALKKDIGRCKFEALLFDVAVTHTEITTAYSSLEEWTKTEIKKTDLAHKFSTYSIRPEPYGVCLIIGTWNYPVAMVLHPLIGAIAAGNCAIVKPSELAPHTAELFSKYLGNFLDQECFPVVVTGPQGSATLVNENRFDMIMYTGSANIGKLIMKAASKHLTPVLLELGGKNPCFVEKTCDLKVAARRIAWGAYSNAGQICLSPDHILCEASLKDQLIKEMKSVVIEFYGNNPKSSPDYARIINERHWKRVMNLMESGDVVMGGEGDESDRYIAPTILDNVTESSLIMQEEVFGPILPIISVQNMDEAIAFTRRRTAKPLALYVFSKNRQVIEKILKSTSSGGVSINDVMMHFNEYLPFGGVGESGLGSYHGKYSFDAFSHKRSVYDSGIPDMLLSIRYAPYTDQKLKTATKFFSKKIPKGGLTAMTMFKLALVALVMAYLYKARFRIKYYYNLLKIALQYYKAMR